MLPMVHPLKKGKSPKRDAAEPWEGGVSDLPKRVGYTVMFLRMTETEVRELAKHTPEIGRELQHIADALNAEANGLAKHVSE